VKYIIAAMCIIDIGVVMYWINRPVYREYGLFATIVFGVIQSVYMYAIIKLTLKYANGTEE
jgi:hypothetical protein